MRRILNKAGFLFIGALLGACRCGSPNVELPTVDPALLPLVTEFKQMAKRAGAPIRTSHLQSIGFGQTEGNNIGECAIAKYSNGALVPETSFVTIHSGTWDSLNPCDRKKLVFHELGHCFLGLPHEGKPLFDVMASAFIIGWEFCEDELLKFERDLKDGKLKSTIFTVK